MNKNLQKMFKARNMPWPMNVDEKPTECNHNHLISTQSLHYKAIIGLAENLSLENDVNN